MSDITKLRSILFNTLDKLADDKSDVDLERVKAINETAQNIVSSAKVEVDFIRATGNHVGTGFLTKQPADGSPVGVFPTANGTKTVTQERPGVTVTNHRMSG